MRDLQFAQELNYPTMDINISRERAGQFGLTMADVARSVVPATSSSRFTQPNYWRDPNSGQAFQIQVELPQNRIQSVDSLGNIPVTKIGQPDTRLVNIATMKPGTIPGLIERNNGQRVVSLTANLHDITLGKAVPELNKAIANAGPPPKGVSVQFRGQIPPLLDTISGLQIGLLLAIAIIFLLLAANFQSMKLALRDRPDNSRGVVRRPVHASAHRNDSEHSVVHGCNHVDRNRSGEFYSPGQFCGTASTGRPHFI